MSNDASLLQEQVAAFLHADRNLTTAAKNLGIPRSTLWSRINTAKKQGLLPDDVDLSEEKFTISEAGDETTIWSVGQSVRTVEDAVAKAEIDLTEWIIVEKVINSYPTSMKLASGNKKENTYVETPHQMWNWQIKLKLRRKAPKPIQDGIKDLLKDLIVDIPKVHLAESLGDHLLEISLYDAHFAKLCWEEEVGHNYDLEIAERDYLHAGMELLRKTSHRGIKEIILPVGHDFFHVDNWLGTTHRGTLVESTDDRFTKVFRTGCRAVRHLIMECRKVAPVRIIWVPGNHDPSTSWYLTEYLQAIFESDSQVTINNGGGVKPYRYYTFGKVLLGYYHGEQIQPDRLSLLMSTDESKAWGNSIHRAWRTGHRHKKKTVKFVTPTDTFMGVRVDVIPSISGTDRWHLEHGFVNNPRTAEAWIWHGDLGYCCHESQPSISQLQAWEGT